MDTSSALKDQIRSLIVDNLMLQMEPSALKDELPLFGPGGLGLDSVDALQLVVALDKAYGVKVANPEAAREILRNVNTIASAVGEGSPS